jgi:hypothetical protein
MEGRNMNVTRLRGNTGFSTYVVSVFEDRERIDRIEVNGKPHPSVSEICNYLGISRTKLVNESIKAIKLTMAKHNEYRGYRHE